MNILLTNDDGIRALGLYAIYQELRKHATVTVVAPDRQRSSVGHAITLSKPISYKKIRFHGKFFGYGVSGTPADCVKIALKKILRKPPDVLVSGINLGPNDGCSVFYSGTVAGAREGSLYGIPSIAVSLGTFIKPDYQFAASFVSGFIQQGYWKKIPRGTFLNINVPPLSRSQIKGIKITSQENQPFQIIFKKQKIRSKIAYQLSCTLSNKPKAKGSDTDALLKRYVSITPLKNDLTDHRLLKSLNFKEFRL